MVSSVGTDQLPFTKKKKQCTKRDSNFNLQDGGEILQMLGTFPLRYFGWKFWTSFKDVSFISKMF